MKLRQFDAGFIQSAFRTLVCDMEMSRGYHPNQITRNIIQEEIRPICNPIDPTTISKKNQVVKLFFCSQMTKPKERKYD
jgi:hypothetical protein